METDSLSLNKPQHSPDSEPAITPSPGIQKTSSQPTPKKKTLWLVIILAFLLLGTTGIFAYKYYELKQQIASQQSAPSPSPKPVTSSPLGTLPPEPLRKDQESPQSPTSPPISGADLSEIEYTLPDGWNATIRSGKDDLFLSPKEEGGFLAIKVYSYDGKIGRREYYCQVAGFCIDEVTYFTPIQLGNVSGYKANALDNSGGGSEYFGAKGDKFYIISSFSPSYPADNYFDKTYQQVLDSLVF